MDWVPVDVRLPKNGEAVLLRLRSNVELGHYDEAQKQFVLQKGGNYDLDTPGLLWMELVRPF